MATTLKVLRTLAATWFVTAFGMSTAAVAALPPGLLQQEGDVIVRDFHFQNGETLPEVRLHYTTLGKPQRDASGHVTNAVLLLHGTTGTGKSFLVPTMAGELFGPNQPLDASRYYIIMPDGLGRGGSSKPSDGLRARFPKYGYGDVVNAQYRLVRDGLGVDHLRLVLGVSMGGMQAWMWAERYPDRMDAVMPIACQPMQISGRNLIFRRILTEAIRNAPDWNSGDYTAQPRHWVFRRRSGPSFWTARFTCRRKGRPAKPPSIPTTGWSKPPGNTTPTTFSIGSIPPGTMTRSPH